MLTIAPPVSCCCITALAACAHQQRREQVEPDDLVVEARRGRRPRAAYGAPPALLTSTSSRPCVGDDPRRPAPDRLGVAHVADVVGRARQRLDLGAGAGDDRGAGGEERLGDAEPDAPVPPVTSTTRPDRSRASAMLIPYQANAWLVRQEAPWPSP